MELNRRSFLAGGTLFAAGALARTAAAARAKGEETYTPPPVVKGVRRVKAEPVLQCPAPDSMGVAWAVDGLANGAVEFSDNPQLQNAKTVRCGGFGMTSFDDQALQVRLVGLKPGTRYWYRTITTPIASKSMVSSTNGRSAARRPSAVTLRSPWERVWDESMDLLRDRS